MTIRKRTSRKTGTNSRRTTTLSSTGGKTESYSNKPSKNSSRRTVSFNHKTGKTRTTYSTKLGGGYTRITSKTTGGSTRSKPRKNRKSSGGSVDVSLSFPLILTMIVIGTIMYLWPITIPYIVIPIVSIVVLYIIIEVVLFILPYVIWGAILYGLYKLFEFIL